MSKGLNSEHTLSLGLVLAIITETACALLWVGAAEARINTLETQTVTYAEIAERLARIEEQMSVARTALTRIENQIDQAGKD